MSKKDKEVRTIGIQQAATVLFKQYGYTNVTMDRIAAKAHITKRTLYKHFPSKLTLLSSLIENNLKQLSDLVVRDASTAGTITETLKALLMSQYNFTLENLNFMQLYWMLGSNEFNGEIPLELTNQIKKWSQRVFETSSTNIAEKKLTGFFSDYSPQLMAKSIAAINKGLFMQTSKDFNLGIDSVDREKMRDFFLAWIDFGLSPDIPAANDNVLNKHE